MPMMLSKRWRQPPLEALRLPRGRVQCILYWWGPMPSRIRSCWFKVGFCIQLQNENRQRILNSGEIKSRFSWASSLSLPQIDLFFHFPRTEGKQILRPFLCEAGTSGQFGLLGFVEAFPWALWEARAWLLQTRQLTGSSSDIQTYSAELNLC